MEYWDRQFQRHAAGEPRIIFTLDGVRSAMRRYNGPGSLSIQTGQ
jgi:hypothetical protein